MENNRIIHGPSGIRYRRMPKGEYTLEFKYTKVHPINGTFHETIYLHKASNEYVGISLVVGWNTYSLRYGSGWVYSVG